MGPPSKAAQLGALLPITLTRPGPASLAMIMRPGARRSVSYHGIAGPFTKSEVASLPLCPSPGSWLIAMARQPGSF